MRRFGRACFLVVVSVILGAYAALAKPIKLDGHSAVRALGLSASFIADPSGALTLGGAKDALAEGRFEPVALDHFDVGYSITPHWVL